LHLTPSQDDITRDTIYASLKTLAEADALDGLDVKVMED